MSDKPVSDERKAEGFEPLDVILARMVERGFFAENLALALGTCHNEAAPGGVDAPAEGLTETTLDRSDEWL